MADMVKDLNKHYFMFRLVCRCQLAQLNVGFSGGMGSYERGITYHRNVAHLSSGWNFTQVG